LGQEFGKALQEIIPVSVFEEDLLTVDTPDHDVVKDSRCVQSGLSWHGKTYLTTTSTVNLDSYQRYVPCSTVPGIHAARGMPPIFGVTISAVNGLAASKEIEEVEKYAKVVLEPTSPHPS